MNIFALVTQETTGGLNRNNPGLRLYKVIPIVIALFQFVGLLIWTLIKWHRYAYTWDFAIYYQAAYLIAHGHVNPFSTVLGFPFIQNDFEIIMWPIGWLLAIVHSPFLLPFLQDLALSTTTWITLLWVRDIVVTFPLLTTFEKHILQALAVILMIGTPWVYWTASFDFHIEPIVLPFVVLAGWSFWKNNRRMGYFWTAIFLLGGNVAATYAFGLGVMELLRGRKHFLNGLILIIISGSVLVAIEKLVPGGIKGGNLASLYGYLAGGSQKAITIVAVAFGMLMHPGTAFSVLWHHRLNILGEISPAGLIGVLSPLGFGISFVVLLTDNLISGSHNSHAGLGFGDPQYFQGIITVPFVVVGTIFIIAYLHKYITHRWIWGWYTIIVLAVCNTIMWFFIYIPQIPHQLVNINLQGSKILSSVHRTTKTDQQVVSTQAFVGRFAGRNSVSTFMNDGPSVPITNHHVLFLISPYQGIEVASAATEIARIWYLANLPGVTLITHGAGIWAFQFHTQKINYQLNLNLSPNLYPAWALKHPAGQPVLTGPVSQWHMASTGQPGYVVDGFYKRLNPGSYRAVVSLSTTSPVIIEVWNATGSYLLRRDTIIPTNGTKQTIVIPFSDPKVFPHKHFFHGYGLWKISPPPPPAKNELEIRIWSSGKGLVNVYGLNILSANLN